MVAVCWGLYGATQQRTAANPKTEMNAELKSAVRKMILDELKKLLDEFRQVRSLRLSENDDSTRSDYLAKRVEFARGKLDDLKSLQMREKEIRHRRQEIDRDNAARNRKNPHDK